MGAVELTRRACARDRIQKSTASRIDQNWRADLSERWLVQPYTTVVIPFDDRVLFVHLPNCAKFSSRDSEVAQTLDTISGIQLLTSGGGFHPRILRLRLIVLHLTNGFFKVCLERPHLGVAEILDCFTRERVGAEVQATTLRSRQVVTLIIVRCRNRAYTQKYGLSLATETFAARRYTMPTLPQVTRLSLKNILFPTDFSPASKAALPFAVALARTYSSTLLITHAIPTEPFLEVVTDRLPAQDDRVRQDARHKLNEFTHSQSLASTPVKVVLDQGDLQDVIPAIIEEQNIDLVVLGTHGRRGVSKLVLGSGAETIYRSATCPVLTIGPQVHDAGDWKLRRILCSVDIAEDPEQLMHYALSFAEENQSDLVILQAIPLVPWQQRPAVAERCRRALNRLIPEQAKDWCTPEILIRWEHAVEAILETAHERESDLIIMSVHKSRVSALAAHLPWPVASEVVSRAPCPVLTVRV